MNNDNQELIERVEKSLKRQKLMTRWAMFGVNCLFFLLSVIMVVAYLSNPDSPVGNIPNESLEVFIVPLALWFLGLGMQLGITLMDSDVMDKEMTSKIITQELGQQIMESKLSEKLKRGQANLDSDYVTINDEGEIVPVEEEHNRRSAP